MRPRAATAAIFLGVLLCALLMLLVAPAGAATPVGSVISNTAAAAYSDGPSPVVLSRNSNTVTLTTVALRTHGSIEFLKYAPQLPGAELFKVAPGAYRTGSDPAAPFSALTAPLPAGSTTPIDLSKPVPLAPAAEYHSGESIFVRVSDLDQNVDPGRAETVIVTVTDLTSGEVEVIRLTETGPDTGVFVGYIQSTAASGTVTSYSGSLPLSVNSKIKGNYTDAGDGTDSSSSAALVDPYGIIFDSATGRPIDGVTITLIDQTTGRPASVLGDDGVSAYPATVKTGAVVSDVSGRLYAFPPGGFRYPFVNPGRYRFQLTPPAGYSAPSAIPFAAINALPGGPFALAGGSRLEEFTVNPGPTLHIDVPLDPVQSSLWLQKIAGRETAATGDLVPYQLDLQNSGAATVSGITLSDTLPLGFRYRQGSARLNGVPAIDPGVSPDGRTLSFAAGELPAKGSASIRYLVEVAAGARPGAAVNVAIARSPAGVSSNVASAGIEVRSDFLSTRGILAGEVLAGPCQPSEENAKGVAGIRLLMEDGSYVVTDERGRYHFEGLTPGSHVVQLDLDSVPLNYQITSCEENSRFAGTPYSQFVDLQGGTLWRADFRLRLKPQVTGAASLELESSLKRAQGESDTVELAIPVRIGSVPVHNLRLTVMLPDSASYRAGSSTLNALSQPDPADLGNVLTFALGDVAADWQGTVRLLVMVPHAGKGGKLVTRALLTFDTPTANSVRTPLAENALVRRESPAAAPATAAPPPAAAADDEEDDDGAATDDAQVDREVRELQRIAMPEFVLHPHFPTFGAELSPEDRKMLDELARQLMALEIEQITVTGHTDTVRIAPRSRKVYQDNKALSLARAFSVGDYLINALHLPQAKLVFSGLGESSPIAENRSRQGRALNRRVEIKVKTAKVVETVRRESEKAAAPATAASAQAKPPAPAPEAAKTAALAPAANWEIASELERSGVKSVATVGLRPGEIWKNAKAEQTAAAAKEMPDYDAAWVEKAAVGEAWLWPPEGYNPAIPSVSLAVKHDPRSTLKLFLNGEEVEPLFLDGTVKRQDESLAVSTWRGVHLRDGDNDLAAVRYDRDGRESLRVKRTIHYSTAPVKAELVAGRSRLAADGKTPAVLALRLTDKDGHPARPGVICEYVVDAPYLARRPGAELKKPLPGAAAETLKCEVGEDGIALIELQPTTRTGEAVARVKLESGVQEVRGWLKPEYRDWILVGLGEGTVGYNAVAGHLENLREAGVDEHLYQDGRLALYAKGQIKGEWLATIAYDSAKGRGETGNRSLFQTIDPNTYYTLYGDATNQQYDAASQRKLYLKIERDQFYALFGDFDTGLTVTELSRYSRRLNGLKAEWHGKTFEGNVFGTDTAQAYARDEIQGDGTSGLYRLSRKNIVLNSDRITIEVRDRFRSEIILSSSVLSRFTDYSIDYQAGTVFFKQPIHSRDENFNPIFIVAEYETEDAGSKALTLGGRVGAKLLNGALAAGVSYIHEGQVSGSGNLYGADAAYKLWPGTLVRGEVAHTDTEFGATAREGNAFLAELQHQTPKLQAKFYFRDQENGFGLGQQNGSESGTRKGGAESAYKLTDTLGVSGQLYRQYNLATGAIQDVVEEKTSYASGPLQAHLGMRYAADRLGDGSFHDSEQLTAGGSWLTLNKRLNLHADHDQSIGGNDNASFPTRTTFGADFKLTEKAALFAQEELTSGSGGRTNTTSAGLKSSPWQGGTFNSSLGQNLDENGQRMFALFGLKQTWKVTEKWSLDAGLDRSQSIISRHHYQFNVNVPPPSGASEDFTAVSLGSGYAEQKWNWNGRVEYRTSDSGQKWNVLTSWVGEPKEGVGASARLQLFDDREGDGSRKTNGDLRFGGVYRPLNSRWIILDRLDFLYDRQRTSGTVPVVATGLSDDSRRVVNNLNANLKPDAKNQLSLLYGAKYVLENIDGRSYTGYTDVLGIEWRHDLTERWDLGVRGSLLHSWSVGQLSYSAGPSVGYNVVKNAWVSLGYNLVGFSDKDFSAANYTAQGPFVRFRFKFDQNSVRDAANWINRE